MEIMKRYGFELYYPKYGFDEAIGGYKTLKEYLRDSVIKIIRDDIARSWGVGASRGILLFGPGGTGKSLFAKYMAKELELPFIKVTGADIFRGIVGETERAVKTLQKVAEANAPCIVFIDEVDQLGLRRDAVISTDSGVGRRAMNMLMDWLGDEERRSIVVGATNVVEQLDPAFMRAGRFDSKIPLLLPDFEARVEIIKVHTSVVRKIPLQRVDLKKIAERTRLWSGAEIENLCVAAARISRRKGKDYVTSEDFEEGFDEVTVNTEMRQKELEYFIQQAKVYASSRRLLKEQLEEYVAREQGADRLKVVLGEL
jgi:proteasome regulatory subunit